MVENNKRPNWKESDRLAALRRYDVLDTPPEPAFDSLVRLAAHVCDTPLAAINLLDDRRQWFKAEVGWGLRETITSGPTDCPGFATAPPRAFGTRARVS